MLKISFLSGKMDSALKWLMENDKISFKEGLNLLRKSLREKHISSLKNISRSTQEIMESTAMPTVLSTAQYETPGRGNETRIKSSTVNKGIRKLKFKIVYRK